MAEIMKDIIIDGYNFTTMPCEKYWSLPKNKDPKVEIKNAVFSGKYIAARKRDGNWAMLIKDNEGEFHLRSRSESVNGGYIDKAAWIPHITEELDYIPGGTVLIGEIYLPKDERSRAVTTIMGCLLEKSLKRQEDENKKIHFYIFDCLAYNGKNIMNEPFERRVNFYLGYEALDCLEGKYIHLANYYEGQELWDYIGKVLAAGGEGVVLQSKDAPYEPNKRKAWKTIKVKKEIENELDLFITGNYKLSTKEYKGIEISDWVYWEHKRTGEKMFGNYYDDFKAGATIEPITKGYYFGWAGSIELAAVDKEGKVIPVAWISNVTEDVKKKIITGELNKQVVKVQAMEIEPDTRHLRHAKITEFRKDKDWKDCGIAQLY